MSATDVDWDSRVCAVASAVMNTCWHSLAKTAPRLTTGRWSITKLFEPHLLIDDGDS